MEARYALPGDAWVARADRLISTKLADGELVVLSLEDGMYYGLNAVGARVWALIEEPLTVREVQARLVEEFRVDPERCSREVNELLTDLVGLRLVRLHSSESTGAADRGAGEGREEDSLR